MNTENLQEMQNSEAESAISFRTIMAMFILNWQWFLLSMFICLCTALIYLRYASPVYQVSAKILIKDDNTRRRSNANMLANMQELGFMTNSNGIENEVEILQSRILARDAVIDLKLYTDYKSKGRIKKTLLYKNQPVNVDIDSLHLAQMDKDLMTVGTKNIKLTMVYRDGQYELKGQTLLNGRPSSEFEQTVNTFPTIIKTKYGTLTLTKNIRHELDAEEKEVENGSEYYVTIVPPMIVATSYARGLNVAPTSKMTSIAQLTLTDRDPNRGIDFLNQLTECYNRQANEDKNEIALRTEEFINERLTKIDAELGSTEDKLENYKKRNALTQLQMDATQTLQMSTQYETKLAEANTQIHLLDYLREYIDKPENMYKTIPSNVGMTDAASVRLIDSYNKTVQDRNRLLKAASEQGVIYNLQGQQVMQPTKGLYIINGKKVILK